MAVSQGRGRDSELQLEYGHHLAERLAEGKMTRRDFIRRATVLGLSAGSIGTILAACGTIGEDSPATSGVATTTAPQATTPPQTSGASGVISIAMNAPLAAVEPVTMADVGAIAVAQQVAEYLVWAENDLSLRPVLAERWEPRDDGQAWLFDIRPGVSFNDGRPLTATDVVATFERLVDPDQQSAALSNFAGILSPGGVEEVGELQVVFNLDGPFVDFPFFLSSVNFNSLILPADYDGDFASNPVGTGPFSLTELQPEETATFARNPDYWNADKILLEGALFRFFGETQAQTLALQAGDVDVMLSTPFTGAQALFEDTDIEVLSTQSSGHDALHLRLDEGPLADKRIRQAIALALDREAIIQALYGGRSAVGQDHMFAPVFGVNPDVPARGQDYERAGALLAEAGVEEGFSIELMGPSSGVIPQYAQLVQEMLRPTGIEVSLNLTDGGTYYGSGDNQPWLEVPMGITGWAARALPAQLILPAYTCDGIWNSAHWCNEEFDTALRDYQTTLDEGRRQDLATELASIQQDETPAVISYWTDVFRATRSNVSGLEANGASFLDLTSVSVS